MPQTLKMTFSRPSSSSLGVQLSQNARIPICEVTRRLSQSYHSDSSLCPVNDPSCFVSACHRYTGKTHDAREAVGIVAEAAGGTTSRHLTTLDFLVVGGTLSDLVRLITMSKERSLA